jgi:hypothetical protein
VKAQLILIASAFLLVSNIAGAQEPEAPTAKMTGQDTMGHAGGQEYDGPYVRRHDGSRHDGSWHVPHHVRLNGY